MFGYRNMMMAALLALLAGCQTPTLHTSGSQNFGSGEMNIAASALRSGDLNVAQSLYERMTQQNPGDAAAWQGLADTRFLQGYLGAANDAYVKAQQLAPNRPDAYLGQARILIRQRDLPAAIACFQSILARFPDNSLALSGLGVSYDLSGDPAQAQRTYRRGLLAHPDDVALRANLGLSLALNGKPREAVNQLLGSEGLSGKLPQERDNLALAYGLLGRDNAAEEILQGSLSRDQVQDNLSFYRYVRQSAEPQSGQAQ